MRKMASIIFGLILMFAGTALVQAAPVPAVSNIFYYSTTCPHCQKVEVFFNQYGIVAKYNIISKEVSQNPQNAKELYDAMSARGITPDQMGVPYLDFEGQGYFGDTNIINLFRTKLNLPAETAPENKTTPNNQSGVKLNLAAVLIAGLADAFNPCAFSVMIFLLLTLLSIGSRKRMLKIGLIYILSVYLVYFLAGLGILAILQYFGFISRPLLYVAAVLSIFAGLVNIKDFFWYGKGFSLAIGEDKKPIMEKYIKQASIPAAIILGILVALFELPCTGGFYLAILALLANKATYDEGLFYLIMYNVFFITPLLVILLAVYFGASPAKMEVWRTAKKKWMRLIMGIVLVGLGVMLFFI